MVGVPEVVRTKALTFGAVEWLDSLPELIEGLERDWVISVGDPFPSATEAFVAAATVQGGTPAVLKLIMPRDFDACCGSRTATDASRCSAMTSVGARCCWSISD